MRVAALVLAAGASRRAGGVNKLLARDAAGRSMIARSVATARRSQAERVIVVLGCDRHAVAAALEAAGLGAQDGLVLTYSQDHADGLSASLRCGIVHADGADAALVCLGDMPRVRSRTLDALIARMRADDSLHACVPTLAGARGNPVLWRNTMFAGLCALAGDRGGRTLLDQTALRVLNVDVDDPGVGQDFDTPERLADYAACTYTQERAPP